MEVIMTVNSLLVKKNIASAILFFFLDVHISC